MPAAEEASFPAQTQVHPVQRARQRQAGARQGANGQRDDTRLMPSSAWSPLGGVWGLGVTLENTEPQAILGRINIVSKETPNLKKKESPC